MKKAVSIILSLALALALVAGCSGSDSGSPNMFSYNTFMTPPPLHNNSPAMGFMPGDGLFEVEDWRYAPFDNNDEFATASESTFKDVRTSPLSTFSASVNTASYSIMRRQITQGMQPNGLRIEELVNYFDYNYPAPPPGSEHPFAVITEISQCPWAEEHLLAKVAIQGARLQNAGEIANNIVFLIDVSGSMDRPDRLPLVIESMKLLISQLNGSDRISIVTYAGSDRILADSIPGSDHGALNRIVDNLRAGGSTAGARGLRTAYELASKNFIVGGNNRIILATDGDFNVGESSVEALINLVEAERDKGIFISVLGYGMGNLKDNMMEAIASHGNGNYAYIDTIHEAKKVLVDEFDSTLFTIAKDVKFQVEFNPETVSAYRLIGYDTRRLENEDFNDDMKDAGEVGSGHSVTAFFEIIPVWAELNRSLVDPLRYSNVITTGSNEFMVVKVRYKAPDGDVSKLLEHVVGFDSFRHRVSDSFAFASAVVEFGLIVTDSSHRGHSSLSNVLSRAGSVANNDDYGLRNEFISLVQQYGQLVRF